ncbi:monooxygenase [Motilibacter aurantiacus]|uniref:monooxygenase n=1 Tax=Motilibacter aurantiacus TaxID=2714955 RepID=UPI001409B3EF|nr:monooxygenase [Motilibacter aurantiacus]NHC45581.1 monooxygenase [Motilibacter aurantiacus]
MTEPYVTLHLWGVPSRRIPAAAARMALDRRPVHGAAGLRFAKLLGTGSGRTFRTRDADLRHWGLLAVWDDEGAAAAFERDGTVHRGWERRAEERLRVALRPLASRGLWSGRQPFGDPAPRRHDGPVAALTRARIRTARTVTFWRAVPPVSAELHRSPGVRLAVGVGEAPVGLQGTFSLWDSARSLVDFAHRSPQHVEAVRRTAETGWYSEELFARFEVLGVEGTYGGRPV